jgi:spermidine synthase
MRIAMWCLLVFGMAAWVTSGRFRRFAYWRLMCGVWLLFGIVGLGLTLRLQARDARRANIAATRNFYGVLAVREYEKDDPSDHYLILRHGRITHGLQFVESPRAEEPTTYYGEKSGVGLAMNALPAGSRRVGLVGLGTGTLAAYGREGDYFRIYEINPDVQRLATNYFKYLNRCQAGSEVVLGDARLSMERESSQQFDLLVLDAFSSDSIPVHLLTREAFEIYGWHLRTNGIIAVHISNHFLDLEPVVHNLARHFNYGSVAIDFDESGETWWQYNSTWMLLTRRERLLDSPAVLAAANPVRTNMPVVPLWTDDFMSVLPIMK